MLLHGAHPNLNGLTLSLSRDYGAAIQTKEELMPAEPLRMDLSKIAPDAYRHFLQLEGLVSQRVEPHLLHLLKLRASQINGCAYCIAMHTDEALRDGEPAERLTMLDAWEESTLYSDKERVALAWVEEVTLIAESGASKESFEALKGHFSEE